MNTVPKVYQFEKLYRLLRPEEQAAFGPWLQGILGNRQKDMLAMFQYWQAGKSWSAQMELLGLDPRRAQGRFDRLRGELVEKLELYLSYLAMQADPLLQKSILLLEVDRRKGKEIFPLMERKVKKFQEEQSSIRDASYHRAAFLRESAKQSFEAKFPPRYRKNQDILKKRMHHWKVWAQLEALEMAHNLQATGLEEELEQLEVFRVFNTKLKHEKNSQEVYNVMYAILNAHKTAAWKQPGLELDQQLIDQLKACQPYIRKDTFTNLHIHLFNFLRRRIYYFPDLSSFQRLIEMFQWNMRDGIWFISRRVYRTINTILLTAYEKSTELSVKNELLPQINDFIESYAQNLPESEEKGLQQLNRAHYLFVLGEFEKVLELQMLKKNFSDPFYDLGYDIICIKAMIELGNVEGIPELIHNLKQRVHKSRQHNDLQKEALRNMLNLLPKLIHVEDIGQARLLRDRIKNTQPLDGRVWMERRIKSLFNDEPFA